jgi:hypothetical protein
MKTNLLSWLTDEIETAGHAIILTHNIDFLFVQSVVLPMLRAIGSPRLTILADAGSALESFRRQHHLLNGLGSEYRVVPVDLGPYRRFHPKAWLLANQDRAVAAIGSGNLTFGGMSANREVWACGASDGEGRELVAALRRYVPQIVALTPLSEAVADNVYAAFSTEFAWVGALGEPAGIAMAPADRPLLDQIGGYVTGDVQRVSVVTPFFDDKARALIEIATRFQAPVTAYLQPSYAGLSRALADSLPEGVSTGTAACNAGEADRPIHAKIIVFHRKDDVILAIGSANCSRAALTLGPKECNAEMMVVQTVSQEAATEFLAGITLTDIPPLLPDEPHAEDENETAGALRVIAARQEVDVLHVAFGSAVTLANIEIESDEGRWPATEFNEQAGTAGFRPVPRMRKVVLTGVADAGVQVRSEPCWVDDEASLNAPATLRRLFRRLQDAQSGGRERADDYVSLLDLFREYLRDPESARGWIRSSDLPTPTTPYDPAAVFADGFGAAFAASPTSHGNSHSGQVDTLSIIAALFRVHHDQSMSRSVVEPASEIEEDQVDGNGMSEPPPPAPPPNPARLRRAIQGMVEALAAPAYIQGRRAELLSAEVALAAMILILGLTRGELDRAAYRSTTETLWQSLFFRVHGGAEGRVEKRLAMLSPDAQGAFKAAFASARLSAVLVLWALPEWEADDHESLWFRLSVAQLQHRAPWLFASAPPEQIRVEILDLAQLFIPVERREEIERVWLDIVRSGDALSCLADALKGTPDSELLKRIKTTQINTDDVLWQANSLALPVRPCKREAGVKAEIRLLGDPAIRKFRGERLLPVAELLADDAIGIPPKAQDEIRRLAGTMRLAEGV